MNELYLTTEFTSVKNITALQKSRVKGKTSYSKYTYKLYMYRS